MVQKSPGEIPGFFYASPPHSVPAIPLTVIPAQAGIQWRKTRSVPRMSLRHRYWIPAYAGMTSKSANNPNPR
jgi:hypothetical protein